MPKVVDEIQSWWCDYDKHTGLCQLANYGVIFLDEYGCPIDNEYELEYRYEVYKRYYAE